MAAGHRFRALSAIISLPGGGGALRTFHSFARSRHMGNVTRTVFASFAFAC